MFFYYVLLLGLRAAPANPALGHAKIIDNPPELWKPREMQSQARILRIVNYVFYYVFTMFLLCL